jgi:hypothetical protein
VWRVSDDAESDVVATGVGGREAAGVLGGVVGDAMLCRPACMGWRGALSRDTLHRGGPEFT